MLRMRVTGTEALQDPPIPEGDFDGLHRLVRMVTHPCRQHQRILLPVVGVGIDAVVLQLAFLLVLFYGAEDDYLHRVISEGDTEVLGLGFQDGQLLFLLLLSFLLSLLFKDCLMLSYKPVMLSLDSCHILVVVPVGIFPKVFQQVHVIQENRELVRGHWRCSQQWLPMFENAKGISSEVAVSQFEAIKLPERFEVVVGEQVCEHIFGIEVVEAFPEPVSFENGRNAHPGIERIRIDMVVRVPVSVFAIIPLD